MKHIPLITGILIAFAAAIPTADAYINVTVSREPVRMTYTQGKITSVRRSVPTIVVPLKELIEPKENTQWPSWIGRLR